MQDPVLYETNKSYAKRDAELFVPRMIREMIWRNEELIMDYGCGAGSTAAQHIFPSVPAAQHMSSKMLRFAKKQYPNPRVNYFLGNIMDDVNYDNFALRLIKFDKIFSIYAFHFIKNYR
jgi:hypothetical protein